MRVGGGRGGCERGGEREGKTEGRQEEDRRGGGSAPVGGDGGVGKGWSWYRQRSIRCLFLALA